MMDRGMQALLDRAEIHDVLMRYYHAADRGDRSALRECFTADVRARYEGREEVRGVDALLDQIALLRNLVTGDCRISTHFAGNLVFKALTTDRAEVENNGFAFLVDAKGSAVAVRSLRYLDRLRREPGGWRIAARLHTLDWSADVPCTFARAFAGRLNDMPSDWD